MADPSPSSTTSSSTEESSDASSSIGRKMTLLRKRMADPSPSSTTSSSTEESSDASSTIGLSKRTSQVNPRPSTTKNLAVGGSGVRANAAPVARVQTATTAATTTTAATAPGPAHTNVVYHLPPTHPIAAPNPQYGHPTTPASGPISHYGPAPYQSNSAHNPPNPAPIPSTVGHHQPNQLTHQPNQLNHQPHQTTQPNYPPNPPNYPPHHQSTYASGDQLELEHYLRFVHVNPHSKVLQNALDELGITHYSFFEFFSVDELLDLGIRLAHARALLNGLKKFERMRRMSA